jgi:hypothetical protein
MPNLQKLYSPCLSSGLPPVAFLESEASPKGCQGNFFEFDIDKENQQNEVEIDALWNALDASSSRKASQFSPDGTSLSYNSGFFGESTSFRDRFASSDGTTCTPPTCSSLLSSPESTDCNVTPQADFRNLRSSCTENYHLNDAQVPGYSMMMVPGYFMVAMPPANEVR